MSKDRSSAPARRNRRTGRVRRVGLLGAAAVVVGLVVPAVVGVDAASAVAPSFGTGTAFATGRAFRSVPGDFNRDGKIDLAVTNPINTTTSILLGDGAGSFGPRTDTAAAGASWGIATADFNRDGILDLALPVESSSGIVRVRLGTGIGTFGPDTSYSVGVNPRGVTTGDFNGDGNVDLAVVNSNGQQPGSPNGSISVLMGTGTGTFLPKADYETGLGGTDIVTGDVNGDGITDLVVGGSTSNQVVVHLGMGSGAFLPRMNTAVTAPYAVATGDLDGDGRDDVVVGSQSSGLFTLMAGTGGVLGSPTSYPVPSSTTLGVAVGDVNGDNRLDVVGAAYSGNRVLVWENGGSGSLQNPISLASPTGAGPAAVALTDLNGDARPDIVASNFNGSSVSRFINAGSYVQAPSISGSRSPAANAAGWNNEPVTVSFTCSSPQLATCSSPQTLSNDGANQSVTGTATTAGGGSASTTVSGINIDRTPPTVTGVATTAPNAAGWYREPVTIAWTCADALSGLAAGGACPASSTLTGQGEAVATTASATDKAGNQGTGTSEAVKIDGVAPSTGASSAPTWSTSDVTLALTPTDALSGVASTSYRIDGGETQSGTAVVVSGQGAHAVQFWSTDVAGNVETAQTVTVRIDVQAPSITASSSPAPNAAGWNNGPVTVSFTCGDEDGGSGVASCSPAQSFATQVDTSVTGTATDVAGNSASIQHPVRIDLTAPTVVADVPAANSYGWFNAPVQVGFTCSDTGGSGVATCPAPVVFAGEGAAQPVTGEAADAAGNVGVASGATVSLDRTAPTISGASVQPADASGGHVGTVTVRWTCSDALSGVVACPADQQVSGEGVHVVSGSVTDKAGNTATAEVTIRIDHDPSADPGIVRGTVTDAATGLPVKGATVLLVGPYPSLTTQYTTKTATDGSYLFPLVADGSYKLTMFNSGVHLQSWWTNGTSGPDAGKVTVVHGTNLVANQALTPGHVVQGDLRGPNGEPLAGATVRIQGNGIDSYAFADATGHYALTGQVPGQRTVSFYAYGYEPATVPLSVTASSTLDRTLTPAPVTAGVKGTIRALTADGVPLAGATVRVWMQSGLSFVAKATTGADGRFQVPAMPAGNYQFDVVRGDYQVRWFGDTLNRNTTVVPLTTACTTSGDTSWGDPCARVVDIRMIKP